MLSATRRPELREAPVELTVCIVCSAPIRLAGGHAVRHLEATAHIGCLACLASFEINSERRLDHHCPDCGSPECQDSPTTEWACY